MDGTRICKICGVEYPYCRSEREAGLFRWQDVACSPEHASLYFEEVARARGEVLPFAEQRGEEPAAGDGEESEQDDSKQDQSASKKKQSQK